MQYNQGYNQGKGGGGAQSACFACGEQGHWAGQCPTMGGHLPWRPTPPLGAPPAPTTPSQGETWPDGRPKMWCDKHARWCAHTTDACTLGTKGGKAGKGGPRQHLDTRTPYYPTAPVYPPGAGPYNVTQDEREKRRIREVLTCRVFALRYMEKTPTEPEKTGRVTASEI